MGLVGTVIAFASPGITLRHTQDPEKEGKKQSKRRRVPLHSRNMEIKNLQKVKTKVGAPRHNPTSGGIK